MIPLTLRTFLLLSQNGLLVLLLQSCVKEGKDAVFCSVLFKCLTQSDVNGQ